MLDYRDGSLLGRSQRFGRLTFLREELSEFLILELDFALSAILSFLLGLLGRGDSCFYSRFRLDHGMDLLSVFYFGAKLASFW